MSLNRESTKNRSFHATNLIRQASYRLKKHGLPCRNNKEKKQTYIKYKYCIKQENYGKYIEIRNVVKNMCQRNQGGILAEIHQ